MDHKWKIVRYAATVIFFILSLISAVGLVSVKVYVDKYSELYKSISNLFPQDMYKNGQAQNSLSKITPDGLNSNFGLIMNKTYIFNYLLIITVLLFILTFIIFYSDRIVMIIKRKAWLK